MTLARRFRALPALFAALSLFCSAAPTAAQGQEKDTLIATLESAGFNQTANRRHTVDIQNCTMITHLWQHDAAQGWMLWSTFTVSMPAVTLPATRKIVNGQPRKFVHLSPSKAQGDPETAVITMTLQDPKAGLYERSNHRSRLRKSWPSPRNGGTTHRLSHIERFLIVHEGPGVGQKAETFVRAFETYVEHYCTFTG